MVKSPLIIIVELLTGLISSLISTFLFVVGKLVELFYSLMFLSSLGVFGFLIAIAIGAGVFVFFAKFVFKNWKSVMGFGIALGVVFLVLFLLQLL